MALFALRFAFRRRPQSRPKYSVAAAKRRLALKRFGRRAARFAREAAIELAIEAFPILRDILFIRRFLRNQYYLRGISPRQAARQRAREEWALTRKKYRSTYKAELQRAIRESTRRRTGRLLRVYVKAKQVGQLVVLTENFPKTAFSGRRRGQYAYVVNGGIPNRNFIRTAQQRTARQAKRNAAVAFFRAYA